MQPCNYFIDSSGRKSLFKPGRWTLKVTFIFQQTAYTVPFLFTKLPPVCVREISSITLSLPSASSRTAVTVTSPVSCIPFMSRVAAGEAGGKAGEPRSFNKPPLWELSLFFFSFRRVLSNNLLFTSKWPITVQWGTILTFHYTKRVRLLLIQV